MEFYRSQVDAVETAHIDVDLIGIGARHVERMNAAGGAEGVLRRAGIEAVCRQHLLAAEQFELLRRHDEMQESLLGADRAIALGDAVEIGGDAKAHPAAMATAIVGLWHVSTNFFQRRGRPWNIEF